MPRDRPASQTLEAEVKSFQNASIRPVVQVATIMAVLPQVWSVVLLAVYVLFVYGILGISLFGRSLLHQCVEMGPDGTPDFGAVLGSAANGWQTCTRAEHSHVWGGFHCPSGYECLEVGAPQYGKLNFDNLLFGMLTIFTVITKEHWTDVSLFPPAGLTDPAATS